MDGAAENKPVYLNISGNCERPDKYFSLMYRSFRKHIRVPKLLCGWSPER